MAPTVILSPHPDDAVLSLWHLVAGPGEVVVLNVFGRCPPRPDGDAWWDRLTAAADPAARMRERHTEDREALARAGRRPRNLGVVDGQYRRESLETGRLSGRIARILPRDARLLAPAALDGHGGHRAVRAAALTLAAEHGRAVGLYADTPHSLTFGWPAWVTGRQPPPYLRPEAHWEHRLAECGLSVTDLEPTVQRLDDAALAAKVAAVRAYRTQLPALEAQFGPLLSGDALRYEVVWNLP